LSVFKTQKDDIHSVYFAQEKPNNQIMSSGTGTYLKKKHKINYLHKQKKPSLGTYMNKTKETLVRVSYLFELYGK
jgi:hypothetical protein